jgi:hypothetical protein
MGINDTEYDFSLVSPFASLQRAEGKGIVKLPNGKEFPDDTFNLAVFHQIHCLVWATPHQTPRNSLTLRQYTLRQSFWTFFQILNGTYSGEDRNATYMLYHGNHCFEYLRQAVSCNIDTTLEPFAVERDMFRVWGVQHESRVLSLSGSGR